MQPLRTLKMPLLSEEETGPPDSPRVEEFFLSEKEAGSSPDFPGDDTPLVEQAGWCGRLYSKLKCCGANTYGIACKTRSVAGRALSAIRENKATSILLAGGVAMVTAGSVATGYVDPTSLVPYATAAINFVGSALIGAAVQNLIGIREERRATEQGPEGAEAPPEIDEEQKVPESFRELVLQGKGFVKSHWDKGFVTSLGDLCEFLTGRAKPTIHILAILEISGYSFPFKSSAFFLWLEGAFTGLELWEGVRRNQLKKDPAKAYLFAGETERLPVHLHEESTRRQVIKGVAYIAIGAGLIAISVTQNPISGALIAVSTRVHSFVTTYLTFLDQVGLPYPSGIEENFLDRMVTYLGVHTAARLIGEVVYRNIVKLLENRGNHYACTNSLLEKAKNLLERPALAFTLAGFLNLNFYDPLLPGYPYYLGLIVPGIITGLFTGADSEKKRIFGIETLPHHADYKLATQKAWTLFKKLDWQGKICFVPYKFHGTAVVLSGMPYMMASPGGDWWNITPAMFFVTAMGTYLIRALRSKENAERMDSHLVTGLNIMAASLFPRFSILVGWSAIGFALGLLQGQVHDGVEEIQYSI
ncbi:MAG: hypothetical protein A3F09_03160 [Chlamydiae bacterium RIFCSPHIGHO2_12_FULL_49_11]|nr:MAG: hypothetical protein A3F09_03160 [Chlamydiae bacterium RIFCSPHIGHO2_12_FULL_49_11]